MKYIRRKYYEGTYVMRIIIKPKLNVNYYFMDDNNRKRISKFDGIKCIELDI